MRVSPCSKDVISAVGRCKRSVANSWQEPKSRHAKDSKLFAKSRIRNCVQHRHCTACLVQRQLSELNFPRLARVESQRKPPTEKPKRKLHGPATVCAWQIQGSYNKHPVFCSDCSRGTTCPRNNETSFTPHNFHFPKHESRICGDATTALQIYHALNYPL